MALVSQDPTVFSGSILDNIRYGRPEASEAEVERVVEAQQQLQHRALAGARGADEGDALARRHDEAEVVQGDAVEPEALRARMALVSQDPTVFSGSILDNIRYGRARRASGSTASTGTPSTRTVPDSGS
jgi:ABC-type transport system involved in cytochrome bd biosynthesis fused ATPase/permease subunit